MASSRDRERKLARAKVERQQAIRAQKLRAQRQTRARLLAGLVVLGVLAVVGAVTNWYGLQKDTANAQCVWTPSKVNVKYQKDVGEPPINGNQLSGTRTVQITTNQGTLSGTLNVSLAPCTTASWAYLAGKDFFNNTTCTRVTTGPDLWVLQCGDPTGTGFGGPTYNLPEENLPEPVSATATGAPATGPGSDLATYPAGTIAMANSGDPTTGGSQFFLVYKDSTIPDSYSVVGTLDQASTDLVTKIASGGVKSGGASAKDGPPVTATTIQTLTVGPVVAPPPSVAPSPSGSSTPGSSGPSASTTVSPATSASPTTSTSSKS